MFSILHFGTFYESFYNDNVLSFQCILVAKDFFPIIIQKLNTKKLSKQYQVQFLKTSARDNFQLKIFTVKHADLNSYYRYG